MARHTPLRGTAEIREFPVTPMTPGPADLHPAKRPLVLAVGNQKGGPGKTTVTLGLLEAGAAAGLTCLGIDFDPQANLTQVLHPEADAVFAGDLPSIESCLIRGGRRLPEVMAPALWQNVWIAGAGRTLSGLEQYLVHDEAAVSPGLEPRLRLRHEVLSLRDVDLVVIDLQRSLSVQGTVGILAADGVLGVTEPSTFSARGLADLATTVSSLVFRSAHVRLIGLLINQSAHTRESGRIREELDKVWGDRIWQPAIPSRAVIKEAYTGYRQPLREFGDRAATEVADMFDIHLATARAALSAAVAESTRES